MTLLTEHTELMRYLVGAGLLAACLLGVGVIMWLKHRKRSWARSITVHVVQLLLLFIAIDIARQYCEMALLEFHIEWVTPRLLNLIADIVAIAVFIRYLFLLINRLERNQIAKGRNATSARMVTRVLKLSASLTVLLFFGERFGLSMSGLLAFGGIGGIAIGMASKDVLSNIFSGAMLYFDRQFNIGDWIRSPDRNIEGTVVEIGWRLTKIQTFENRPLYVPNSLFSSISVESPGRMTNRRINTEIGLRYEDSARVGTIVEQINTMLKQHPDIDQQQTLLVYFNAFADSSLNIMVYCFTKTTNWAEWLGIQQNVYLKIIDIVQKNGADFAFPSQTVYLEDSDNPSPPNSAVHHD